MIVRTWQHREFVGSAAVVLAAWLVALSAGCGSSPAPREPSSRASTEPAARPRRTSKALDPAKSPKATTVFNVAALRSGERTARTLLLLTPFLPQGETVDDVEWLAVDGPSPLASPTSNIVFIAKRSTELRTVRGPQSGFSTVAPPKPPDAKQLVTIHVRAPRKIIRVPFFEPPETVEELSIVVEATDDGGVDFHLRERSTDPANAAKAAASLDAMVARLNRGGARALTQGMFADAKATVEGNDALLDVRANPDQVEAIVEVSVTLARGP
ncbi:MAG: hypothetical protein JWP97_5385 [Labilithrix sp.]|nr:hypothetical protein [Labilithrix sp.]